MWLEDSIISLLNRLNRQREATPVGLKLGSAHDTGRDVVWPNGNQDQHLFSCGKTGSGKTTWLLHLASQLMDAGRPFVFFDYHGDATQQLLAMASRRQEASNRLVLLDLTDTKISPGLNLLEAMEGSDSEAFARSSELAAILRQRWHVEAFGARTEELLRNTLYTLAVNHYTLVEAPLLLTSKAFRAELVGTITQPEILDYWNERYEPLSDAMKGTFREPLLNKITGFLTEPACRHFLGQRESTFTFQNAIDSGGWVLINLAKGYLREHAHTLGNLIFARLQFEILARAAVPEHRRRLVTVFADEAQNLAENDLEVLLTEGRKFKVSLLVSCQFAGQLPKQLLGSLLAVGTHAFFQLSAADASTLAAELSVSAKARYHKELTLLSRGQAVVRIGAKTPVVIQVPRPSSHQVAPATTNVLRALSLDRYGRQRIAIETDIRRRRESHSAQTPQLIDNEHGPTDPTEGQSGW